MPQKKSVYSDTKLISDNKGLDFKVSKDQIIEILLNIVKDEAELDKNKINSLKLLVKMEPELVIMKLEEIVMSPDSTSAQINAANMLLRLREIYGTK